MVPQLDARGRVAHRHQLHVLQHRRGLQGRPVRLPRGGLRREGQALAQRTSGNPFTAFGQWLSHKIQGEDWPPDIPDPAITFGEHTEEGHAGAKNLPIKLDKKLKTPGKYVLPNGATITGTAGHTTTTEHWYIYKDANGNVLPATAIYHTTSGEYTAKGSRKGEKKGKSGRGIKANGDVGLTWDSSNTTRVTREDTTGKLRNIRYVVTYGDKGSLSGGFGLEGKNRGKGKKSTGFGYSNTHSDGKLHTEVVQINFSNDQERAAGENWLNNHGLEMPPSVANNIFPKTGPTPGIPDYKADADPPAADADPFDKLIYNKGMGWKTDADTKEKAQELNATLPFGKGIGIDMSISSEDAKTKRAWILDAPGSDGKRHWIDYPDCTAAGNH